MTRGDSEELKATVVKKTAEPAKARMMRELAEHSRY
jgi:hypothetical protein